jgi:hypothetical protein
MRLKAMIVALLLAAAACGGGETATEPTNASAERASAAGDSGSAERATAEDAAAGTADGAPDGTSDDDSQDANDADASEPDDGGDAGEGFDGELPTTLADFFGYGEEYDPEEEQARFEQQERQVQELVAACMAEEGWDYTPYIPDFGDVVVFGPGEDLSQEEWVQQYGFGISTHFLEEITGGFEERAEEFNPEDDPNFVYRESLTPGEQEAYDRALYGDFDFDESDITYDEDGNEIFPEYEPSGCYNEAAEEVYNFGSGGELEAVYQELEPLYEDLFARIEADPRLVDIRDGWKGCMGDAGYAFTDEEEMYMSIEEQMSEFYDAAYGNFDEPLFDEDGNIVDENGDLIEDWQPEPPSLSDEQMAALAELNDYEIAVATANYECTKDFQQVWQEVSEEYEAEFIRSNIALLTQVREVEGR